MTDLSPSEYEAFKSFLQDSSGILLGENKQRLLKARLRRLMSQQGFSSFSQLLSSMREGQKGLLEAVIEAITINEMLWFGDSLPFKALKTEILPSLSKRLGRPIRIWSAGCSGGQDPYSIAICIHEFRRESPKALQQEISIVATDISSSLLEQARRGEYELLAIGRGLSAGRQAQFFESLPSGSWRIRPEIRSMVVFRALNLLQPFQSGKFDLISCRNVLIYFSPEHRKNILQRFHDALEEGGYLILGSGEAVDVPVQFRPIHSPPGFVYYQKTSTH